ncbi:hypothetical protein D6T64_12295 [Cryobacterium melibiosiphilum]|uniref:Uncharacterized protein n=1 Tax=Cryobacterium melibiosiphilum TaxID=995039 RepID=A0A3A5MIW9_9MICO|nr:hypothetical protein [Cryobacterium melibiosiphilum]RJT87879.1 hypothetical protein D6T64_12295 [Cryobacterium melibiosiphilum]
MPALTLIGLLLAGGPVAAAFAATGNGTLALTVAGVDPPTGSIDVYAIDGETSGAYGVVLANLGSDPTWVRSYPADVGAALNGGPSVGAEGARAFPETSWLDFDAQTDPLGGDQQLQRDFTVTVPLETPRGKYIAALVLEQTEPPLGRVAAPVTEHRPVVFVNIHVGEGVEPAFSWAAPVYAADADGPYLEFQVANTGSSHVNPAGTLTVRDETDQSVGDVAALLGEVYSQRTALARVSLAQSLEPGDYTLAGELADLNSGVTAVDTVAFTVTGDVPTDVPTALPTARPTSLPLALVSSGPAEAPADGAAPAGLAASAVAPSATPTSTPTARPTPTPTPTPTASPAPAPNSTPPLAATDDSSASAFEFDLEVLLGATSATARVSVDGWGLEPGSGVQVFAFSTPQLVAEGYASGDGTFTASQSLPLDLPAGDHTLLVLGTGVAGSDGSAGAAIEQRTGFSISADGRVTSAAADAQASVPGSMRRIRVLPFAAVTPLDNPAAVIALTVPAMALLSMLALAGGTVFNRLGQRLNSQDAWESESTRRIDVKSGKLLASDAGWGDRLPIWNRRAFTRSDSGFRRVIAAAAGKSSLAASVLGDASALRAMAGSLALVLPLAGILLGLAAVVDVDGRAMPPGLVLFALIVGLGAIDALAGVLAMSVLWAGVLFSGGIVGSGSVLTLLGMTIITIVPSLVAQSFRSIRRRSPRTRAEWWERGIDLVVVPLVGAWATQKFVGALAGLSGYDLPITAHADSIAILVGGMLMLKTVVEEVATRFFPGRLVTVAPLHLPAASRAQVVASAVLQSGLFVLVSSAFVGLVWQVLLGALMFAAAIIAPLFETRFRNRPAVWQALPTELAVVAINLVFGILVTSLLIDSFGAGADVARMAFVVLPLPMMVIAALKLTGRAPAVGELKWFRRPHLAAVYRLGGLVLLAGAVGLAVST